MKTPIWLVYPHDLKGKFIDVMEGPGQDVSHAAILLPDETGKLWVYEAVGTGFQKINPSQYDGIKLHEYMVEIQDIQKAIAKAESMLGTDYSKLSCVEGFINDITGLEISQDSQQATNCSESVTIIVRDGGGEICYDTASSCITPEIMQEYFDTNGIEGEIKNAE